MDKSLVDLKFGAGNPQVVSRSLIQPFPLLLPHCTLFFLHYLVTHLKIQATYEVVLT